MPARVETSSAIGTAPDACDVYDKDNIFLTDEGWVYRHYKKADKSKFWDEIIVAGEVVAGATIGGVDNDPVDAIGDATPTFEVGDGTQDFENSPTVGEGGGAGDAGGGDPPAAPETSIGGVNLDIVPAAMTVGVNETFAASINGYANITWVWSKASGPGNATISFPNAATTQIQVDTAGDYVFTAEASSTDANLTGGSPNSLNTGTITATDPAPAGVTLNLTGAEAGNSAYQTDSGNNATVIVTVGQTLTINNNSGGHPVDIVVSDGGAQVSEGTLSGAPAGNGETVTWDTTGVTPGDYYYQCTSHTAMIGTITVAAA